MTDLHTRLAEIREMQGREPLPDPTKIQGFDANALPPPDFVPRPPVDLSQVPDGPVDWSGEPDSDDDMYVESPLIPKPEISGNFPEPVPALPKPDLAVVANDGKCIASFEGRELQLTEREYNTVRGIVIRAIERDLRQQAKTYAALLPKRKRKVRANTGTSPEETPQTGLPQEIRFASKIAAEDYIRAGRLTMCKAQREEDHWVVVVKDKPGRKPRKRLDGSER